MNEKIDELLSGHRDAITVGRVFGEPLQKNGVTLIPAASVMGGGGGGSGDSPDGTGEGSGSGFGMSARPAGAYVIRGDDVSWQPAIDVNRIAAGILAYLTLRLILGRRRVRRQRR
jgi:uncharacterized spore protein YtfJ